MRENGRKMKRSQRKENIYEVRLRFIDRKLGKKAKNRYTYVGNTSPTT